MEERLAEQQFQLKSAETELRKSAKSEEAAAKRLADALHQLRKARRDEAAVTARLSAHQQRLEPLAAAAGTQVTCFTGTKLQILTQRQQSPLLPP